MKNDILNLVFSTLLNSPAKQAVTLPLRARYPGDERTGIPRRTTLEIKNDIQDYIQNQRDPKNRILFDVPNFSDRAIPPVDLSDSEIKDLKKRIIAQMKKSPTPEGPAKPSMPIYGTEDAVKGGLGLLLSVMLGGNQGLASFAQSYAGQKQNLANKKTLAEQQNIDFRNQQNLEGYNRLLQTLQVELGFKEDERDRQQRDYERRVARAEASKAKAEKPDDSAIDTYVKARASSDRTSNANALKLLFKEGHIGPEEYLRLLPKYEMGDSLQLYEDANKKSTETIDRWQSQMGSPSYSQIPSGSSYSSFPKEAADWLTKNQSGFSKADLEIDSLQQQKAFLAEAAAKWREKNGMKGNAMDSTLQIIRNKINTIEAQIQSLTRLGGTDVISRKRQNGRLPQGYWS
jgi:hypothetical protein